MCWAKELIVADKNSEALRTPSSWWRTVLGEYPTGVTLITSTDTDGNPVGMIVGTFNAVSESPVLIGFLPMRSSYSYSLIRENGTFCANVLGAEHEAFCRDFFAKPDARFSDDRWETSDLGNPRLRDAVAWFEGRITDITPAGDHDFVLAEVTSLGIGDGNAGLPLLFLRGGYGSFATPTTHFDASDLGEQLRSVERAKALVQELADETGTECLLATVADDSVVVLDVRNSLPNRPQYGILGMTFPFAAPLSPSMAAWGPPERRKSWEEQSRHLLGSVNRPLIAKLLESVTANGYARSVGTAMAEEFDIITDDPATTRADLSKLWEKVSTDIEQMLLTESDAPETLPESISSIQLPVFDADGYAMFELVLAGFHGDPRSDEFAATLAAARRTAARLTELMGGVVPDGYPQD